MLLDLLGSAVFVFQVTTFTLLRRPNVHKIYLFMDHERTIFVNMEGGQIIKQAIDRFRELTGVTLHYLPGPAGQLWIMWEGKKIRFAPQVKNELRSGDIRLAGIHPQIGKTPVLLVCRYIPKPLKFLLKEKHINYLEAAGNCYIQEKGCFIYINDQKVTPVRDTPKGKLWTAAGMKFIFAILQEPGLLEMNYRELATRADIALGNVGGMLGELEKEKYIRVMGKTKGYFLERENALKENWVFHYPTQLRPKLTRGHFRFVKLEQDVQALALEPDMLWGGEMAGAKITRYLRPVTAAIYTWKTLPEAMKTLRLVPDPGGKLELLEAFWDRRIDYPEKKLHVVPPLLVYAELINDADSRKQETAERIKEMIYDK